MSSGRSFRIWTGVAGMDKFDEAMEEAFGFSHRVYIGKKVPRLLRKIKGVIIKRTRRGRWYRIYLKKNFELISSSPPPTYEQLSNKSKIVHKKEDIEKIVKEYFNI